MSESRFNFITKELFYAPESYPSYEDKFHSVRVLHDTRNKHIQDVFLASWLVYLDESMSILWCQEVHASWICVLSKQAMAFGNVWNTIACLLCMIILWVELVEGKDRPKEMPEPKYNQREERRMESNGLMVRMTLVFVSCKVLWSYKRMVYGCQRWRYFCTFQRQGDPFVGCTTERTR